MTTWLPSAAFTVLKRRASILAQMRAFFADRGVLEVETPLLGHTSVTDPYIESIPALFQRHARAKAEVCYLQTSPEYAMKRLLAAGSGPIYQITKAFRQEELGRWHNPEFTLLEWYRPGIDHHGLMDEMDALLQMFFKNPGAERLSYRAVFLRFLGLDPLLASLEEIHTCIQTQSLEPMFDGERDTLLNLLLTHCIEPHLGQERPCFIFDFPASQAALARIQPTHPPTAARFEVYIQGMEIANGFYELNDANEQRTRFENNLAKRQAQQQKCLPLDEHLLDALKAGLPDCAGVALGIDRLMMAITGCKHINQVMSFDFTRS